MRFISYKGLMMQQVQIQNFLGTKLFILRAFRNLRRLGAVTPSSQHLGALVAPYALVDEGSYIVELGGGTGALTRALLKGGIKPSQLYVIELDSELAAYLKAAMPHINVIQGDATELDQILPPEILGKVKRIVSGIPMINIPEFVRRKIIESCFHIMAPDGVFLQYTYSPRSSINAKTYRLKKKRLGTSFLNFPPATVWQYTRE